MLFTFSGPASSGKTTTLKAIKELNIENFKFIQEKARKILKDFNLPLDEIVQDGDLFYDFQKAVIREAGENLLAASQEEDIYLADRDILDSLVYIEINRRVLSPKRYFRLLKDILYYHQLIQREIIYFCPLEFKQDGIRSRIYYNLGEREAFNSLIKPLASLIVYPGSLGERINLILSYILEG